MDNKEISIIICCAGMGTRLGIGTTKALAKVNNKPIIIRLLEMLDNYDDIRIIVGYQAEKVINVVNEYRKDIMFGFNYEYEKTGVGVSLSKGLLGARKYVVVIDGDLIVNKEDLKNFMKCDCECIGITKANSDFPVYVELDDYDKIVCFSNKKQVFEWSGIAKIQKNRLLPIRDYNYDILALLFPLNICRLRTRKVDTPDDYKRMIEWFAKGCLD